MKIDVLKSINVFLKFNGPPIKNFSTIGIANAWINEGKNPSLIGKPNKENNNDNEDYIDNTEIDIDDENDT